MANLNVPPQMDYVPFPDSVSNKYIEVNQLVKRVSVGKYAKGDIITTIYILFSIFSTLTIFIIIASISTNLASSITR